MSMNIEPCMMCFQSRNASLLMFCLILFYTSVSYSVTVLAEPATELRMNKYTTKSLLLWGNFGVWWINEEEPFLV